MPKRDDPLIPTRRSLLSRLRNWDDQDSWQDFFNTYWRLIYGVAVKAGLTDAEAQDVVQETLRVVAKKMPAFKYDPAVGSFKGWLLHTTRWKIGDQFRKRLPLADPGSGRRTDTGTAPVERVADPGPLPADAVWDAEWSRHLFEVASARVKRQVDGKQYQMFDLYVVQQVAPAKVAEALRVSVQSVYLAKLRISRLIKAEVERLEQQML
jgi:RNA polymerase sigma-70 factor (ECF subfamily)